MEYANAFPSQVDCLTLLVYDKDGKYIDSYTAGKFQTSDENWRMEIDLPAGDYNLLAYGGIDCSDASFRFNTNPAEILMQNLEVCLPSDLIASPKGTDLHPLFYGALEVSVSEENTDYTDATVKMMKDTNNLRIILQNADGTAVNNQDFTFTVTADNFLFDYQNNIIPTIPAEFYPWVRGTETVGSNAADNSSVEVGFAEFSLSRLMATSSPRLNIKRNEDQKTVLSIPLINYLLLLKSEHYDTMGPQEFLDRESRWSMVFFLDGNQRWITTQIIINGWVVRINDIDDMN